MKSSFYALRKRFLSNIEQAKGSIQILLNYVSDWCSCLCTACYNRVARGCSSNGGEVNLKSERQQTALMIAAKDGRLKVVSALLNDNAEINDQNEDGDTALMMAQRIIM